MSDDLTIRLAEGFHRAYGAAPSAVWRAPGRVNLIGEHTDYNDGFVLPCAIRGETRVALRPRADARVCVVALDFGAETDEVAIDRPIGPAPGGGWRDYVRGTLAMLGARGVPLVGADLAIAGDVPRGVGLSSSASLEVAVAGTMAAAAGAALAPAELARVAQDAENDFVGMRCGIMDQLASAASEDGHALLIDCRTLATRAVPLPAGAAIMIVHSGVTRGLVEGHYNARRAQCEAAAAILGVPALRDADPAMLAAARERLGEPVHRRARHVVTENARALAAADALAGGDLAAVGALMAASHASMRDDFEITVPAVDALAATLHAAIGGAGGARMTGGGFGGAVVGLLPAGEVARVAAAVRAGYRTPDGGEPVVMVERPRAGFGPATERAS